MDRAAQRTGRSLKWGFVAGVVAWVVLFGIQATGLLDPLDNRIRDEFLKLRGSRPADPSIAIVEVDDATVRAYGTWPIPRDQYALLINALHAAGARAIGFDILFADSDRLDPLNDVLLADQTAQVRGVVHALAMSNEGPGRSGDLGESVISDLSLQAGSIPSIAALRVVLPFPRLLESTPALGHISVVLDEDGAIRRLPLFIRFENRLYPSLALRLVGYARGDAALPSIRVRGDYLDMTWSGGGALTAQLDRDLATGFTYSGDREAFRNTYSLLDVLRAAGSADSVGLGEAFNGRIVLVGSTATGEAAADVGVTPFSSRTPRLFAEANALDALLRGDLHHAVRPTSFWVAMLVLAIITGLAFGRMSTRVSIVVAIGLIAVMSTGLYVAFIRENLLLPSVAPPALTALILLISVGVRVIVREREARTRAAERIAARSIQKSLLPSGPPGRQDLDVFGFNRPARDVGGDYYDWQEDEEGNLLFALGDVSGKGMAAALLLSHLQASFRTEASRTGDPAEMARGIHDFLMTVMPPGRFATLFLGRLTCDYGLVYCNAGHSPGYLIRGGEVTLLDVNGGAIGLFSRTIFSSQTMDLNPGDWIVLYSDGLTDTRRNGELFGEDRLKTLVTTLSARVRSADEFCRRIVEGVGLQAEDGEPIDDLTLVVVGVKDPAREGSPRGLS